MTDDPMTANPGTNEVEHRWQMRVKKVFWTMQGEGTNAGRAAIFVRFVGCNMWSGREEDRARDAERNGASCPLWCDTDFTKEDSVTYNANALHAKISYVGGAELVVFTGGEPMLQINDSILRQLREAGYTTAIETNGTVSFKDAGLFERPDHICVSPKTVDRDITIEYCDEVKIVMPDYNPFDYHKLIARCRGPVYVQPEDGPRLDEATKKCVDFLRENSTHYYDFRLSMQLHKIIGVE